MKYEQIRLEVPESESSAELSVYLLDPVSVAPEKKRPMVVVVPGGGYRFCSDRESEPIAMQFTAWHRRVFRLLCRNWHWLFLQ